MTWLVRLCALLALAVPLGAAHRAAAAEQEGASAPGAPDWVKPLPAGLNAAQVFRSGEELIANNSGDGPGWSRTEVEAGIARVRKSLADGFRDKAAAHRALSLGYEAMWSRYEMDGAERARFRRLEAEASKKVWELTGEPRWGLDYAVNLPDEKESLAACRAVVARHPRHAPARLALAAVLCRQGPTADGLKHLLAGIDVLDAAEIETRRSELTSQGFQCGSGQGFSAVERAIAARSKK